MQFNLGHDISTPIAFAVTYLVAFFISDPLILALLTQQAKRNDAWRLPASNPEA